MNDDDNNEITQLDLSLEAPTDRAILRYLLEDITPEGPARQVGPGSSRNKAVTTVCLGVTVCLIAWVAWGIGLSPMTALIGGLAGTIVLYLLVHVTADRPGQ